jgi:hypothetical protein
LTVWRKSSFSFANSNCVEVGMDIRWGKSSFSFATGDCVEVGVWQKSSGSGNHNGGCVEVAGHQNGDVFVRDTKDNGTGPVLRFTSGEWDAFIQGAKDGEFDLP